MMKTAQKLESQEHRTTMEQKEASWIIKQAKDADLCLDDDLKAEVIEKMGVKRTKKEASKGKLKG